MSVIGRKENIILLLQSLKQYLDEALKMLETIKAGYTTFKEAVVEKAQYFPSSLKNDLEAYDSALCKHLRVERLILKQQRPVRYNWRIAW